jgi:glycosyltransferase involved in cell wall biosynthesis
LISKFIVKSFTAKIFTVSRFSLERLQYYLNLTTDKFKVVYNGVSEDFHEMEDELFINDPYVLFVGNVKPHKNIITALRAFQKISEHYPRLKLYIVGKKDGFITPDNNLVNIVEELGERVVFTGLVSLNELKNYYSKAQLFVFPSFYEGFGLPLLEAMIYKIPIISSNADFITRSWWRCNIIRLTK